MHAVAVVVRDRQRAIVEHADESGQPALVGAVGLAAGVRRGDEEHRATLDERTVLVGEGHADGDLLQAVGDRPSLADVLQLPHPVVVRRIVCHCSSR